MPPNTVNVARPSRWGNPYVVGEGTVSASGHMAGPCVGHYDPSAPRWYDQPLAEGITAEQAVALYRGDIEGSLGDPDPYYDEIRRALADLAGKNLACWCRPDDPCHADVLLDLANRDRK